MDKMKSTWAKFTTKLQQPEPQNTPDDAPPPSTPNCRLAWPPKLTSPPRLLGEITDLSARPYPRDIGRSFHLGGNTYYIFGDTFCFTSPPSPSFLGVSNNTLALLPSTSNPTTCTYLTPKPKPPEFIPYTDEEAAFNATHAAQNWRYVNWSFGGVSEVPGTNGREAWLFYDQVEVHGAQPVRQCGVGVGRVRVTDDPVEGGVVCERVGAFPLFDAEAPLWGNMACLAAPDGWTYLLGGKGLDNYMARVRSEADFTDAGAYRFLAKGGGWVERCEGPFGPFGELRHDVLQGQGQGAMVYAPGWGPEGRPFLWVGCEKFLTSKLWVGVAERPEGPWELCCLGEMPGGEASGTRYCIYPHLWGSVRERGEMLITWSDDGTMGGKVFAGMFSFAMEGGDGSKD